MFCGSFFPDLGTTIVVNFPLAAQSAVPSIAPHQMPAGARVRHLSDGIDAIMDDIMVQQGGFSVLLDDERASHTSYVIAHSPSCSSVIGRQPIISYIETDRATAVLPYRRCYKV